MKGFPLTQVLQEMKGLGHELPPFEFAIAAINDFFLGRRELPLDLLHWHRLIKDAQPASDELLLLKEKGQQAPFTREHIGWLAHVGRGTNLFEQSSFHHVTSAEALGGFLKAVRGISPEFLPGTIFRQEEFLRRWAQHLGMVIEGEKPSESAEKLKKLDYLQTLKAAQKAEVDLQKEIAERNKIIAEMRAQAERSRSGYE